LRASRRRAKQSQIRDCFGPSALAMTGNKVISEMKKLYKTTAVMGSATVFGIIIGLVRAKFTAVFLGPVGVGIFSQAMTFFQSAETICGLGIGMGITKYVSEKWQKQDYAGVRDVIHTSFVMQAIGFSLFLLASLVFSRHISQFVFSSPAYAPYISIISCAVILAVAMVVLESSLLGIRRPEIFSKARIIYYTCGLIVFIGLISTMGLKGGFWYIIVYALISFGTVFAFTHRCLKSQGVSLFPKMTDIRAIPFAAYSRKLFSYGFVTLVTSAVTWVTILYIRSTLIKNQGADANGFYQVIFAITNYYTPFFTNALWGHVFPKISATGDERKISIEFNAALRFVIIFLTPSLAILFLFRKVFVILLLSAEFLPSLKLFPLYLLGGFFFVAYYLLSVMLLACKRLNVYFIANVSISILYAVLSTLFMDRFGVVAIAIAYAITNVLGVITVFSYQYYFMGLRIRAENIRIFILGIAMLCIVFFMPYDNVIISVVKGGLVLLWFLLVFGKREKVLLRSFLTRLRGIPHR